MPVEEHFFITMASIYDSHQRAKKELPRAQSKNVNKNEGAKTTGRISLVADKISDDEFMAAALGDTEWLRQSLRGSKGVINFDSNGLAPIHLAAIHGRLDSLKLLIDKLKVDVNLSSSTGWRPIHLVISSQNGKRALACLQYLLQRGANHSVCNNDDITPVHQAASEGHVQCLKVLINAGAVLDKVDIRNHKPIDLAKLWGHRKCARILAAESWHREKDHVAKEMKQLDRLKMQNILKEIQQEEQLEAHQQFYGNIAFNEWLDGKGLPTDLGRSGESSKADKLSQKAGKPKGVKTTEKATDDGKIKKQGSSPGKRKTATDVILEEDENPRDSPHSGLVRKPLNTYPASPQSRINRSISGDTEDDEMQVDDTEQQEGVTKEDGKDVRNKGTPRWNTSTHLPAKEYTTDLTDYYPRDEYTMLPKYPLKKGDPVKVLSPKPNRSYLESASSSKRPNLPKDVIDNALTPVKERPVMYKPIAIMDVHKKKHYSDDEKSNKSEAGMHLSNDLNSRLFKTGLLRQYNNNVRARNTDSSSTVASTSPTSKTSNNSIAIGSMMDVDLPVVLKMMKKMNQPDRYPAIKGDEYVLRTKVL